MGWILAPPLNCNVCDLCKVTSPVCKRVIIVTPPQGARVRTDELRCARDFYIFLPRLCPCPPQRPSGPLSEAVPSAAPLTHPDLLVISFRGLSRLWNVCFFPGFSSVPQLSCTIDESARRNEDVTQLNAINRYIRQSGLRTFHPFTENTRCSHTSTDLKQ